MLNGFLLGVIVLRGIFLWMILFLLTLGNLNKKTHCSFHQTLHGVRNILQQLSLYTSKHFFYLRGNKVSENLQKRRVWNFQQIGDSQNRGFSFAGSFRRKTRFLRRKTRFLLTPLKQLSLYLSLNILLVTQKLMRLYDFVIFFKKTIQAAVISKKIRTTKGYFIN